MRGVLHQVAVNQQSLWSLPSPRRRATPTALPITAALRSTKWGSGQFAREQRLSVLGRAMGDTNIKSFLNIGLSVRHDGDRSIGNPRVAGICAPDRNAI